MSHALTERATQEFFSAPTADRFLSLQRAAIESAVYDPSASRLTVIEGKLRVANPIRLLEALGQLPVGYHICPRYHYITARIRESLGEVPKMEQAIARLRACLGAIIETGAGSKDSPFSATFTTDEDDVVRSFGEKVRYQQVVTAGDRRFDVLTAHSGVEFWFDVTAMLQRLGTQPSMEASGLHEIS